MNARKDIFERVKYIMKEEIDTKINCSKLARRLNCDRRTVSRYIDIAKDGKELPPRVIPKKTDGFEHIIEEKVKTTAPAIAIYQYLAKEHGYTGSYSTIKKYIHDLNIEKQKDAVIRFETSPGVQAQVDWKESLKFKTKDGETIKFNIFLLILGFSRTKFLMVTETRDLKQVEMCLAYAFKYLGGVYPLNQTPKYLDYYNSLNHIRHLQHLDKFHNHQFPHQCYSQMPKKQHNLHQSSFQGLYPNNEHQFFRSPSKKQVNKSTI